MLVYGDVTRREDSRGKLARVADGFSSLATMPPGLARHAAGVGVLIEAGELLQGAVDAASAERGVGATEVETTLTPLLLRLARNVWISWRSGFERIETFSSTIMEALAPAIPSMDMTVKVAEGFAFYGVYPESYAVAATRSGLDPLAGVIGIRSIGTTLGAVVATVLATTVFETVRPTGHPFRRRLEVPPRLTSQVTPECDRRFAIVDEGPGLSGSSFGAVADALEEAGVPSGNIHFFPSHEGMPGREATAGHRRRWESNPRHVVTFDELVLRAPRPEHRLASWLADAVGPLDSPLEDISGGGWRHHRYRSEADWPPVNAGGERRKFLFRAGGRTWLAKFAGLGREGERKFGHARALGAAGFAASAIGLCHGFLVERWHGDAVALDRADVDPAHLTAHVARYLAFRATRLGSAGGGAGMDELLAMARHNTGHALGNGLASKLDRWTTSDLERFGRESRPVETDNRMHVWEWLVRENGSILKCDALDHNCGHDLVGRQDIAWDVVGAIVELGLSSTASLRLMSILAHETGRAVDPTFLEFLKPCYLAFQLGAASMAADAAFDPTEIGRLRRDVRRYEDCLARALSGDDR